MFVKVPQDVPVQPAPESAQITPLLAGSFCTVAAKGALWFAWIEALAGFTETEIG
jgi:hypothetical protein